MIEKLSARKYLELSALELLSKTNIEKITVKDICQNCNLSTRTFYKYYRDKYDVINTCFNNELERFYTEYEGRVKIGTFIRYTAEIVNRHVDFYKNVFRYTGQNNIRRYLVQPLSGHYLRIIREYCGAEITQQVEDAVVFFLLGQLAFVEEGLSRTVIPDTETTVEFFENAVPAILLPYL